MDRLGQLIQPHVIAADMQQIPTLARLLRQVSDNQGIIAFGQAGQGAPTRRRKGGR
jgi:hypothetical protein